MQVARGMLRAAFLLEAGMAMVVKGGGRPRVQKAGARTLTVKRQKKFLEVLAATCNVTAAAKAARASTTGLYALRRRSAAFRAEWAAALDEGYVKLEWMLLERSINGTVKTVERGNGSVDRTHEYPNAMALQLLRQHKASAGAARAEHHPEDLEAVRRRLTRKFAALKKRTEEEQGMTSAIAITSGAASPHAVPPPPMSR